MQVNSPPFTSIAQAMGQVAQAPPPPKADGDGDADGSPAKASPPDGVGKAVDVSV